MPVDTTPGLEYLQKSRQLVEGLLDQLIPSEETEPKSLHQAMRYSAMAGGKRLRPSLALAAYEYCGGEQRAAPRSIHLAMAALEMVHTYSLIHDDLPCMDDDDLRRGMPTCHKKFGEALAVLAGDGLHVIAFHLMAQTGSTQAVIELADAIGTSGMLGGQIADLEAEGRQVTREQVIHIHSLKTGSLIRASVRVGAILAGADSRELARLTQYAEKIGLAFQIIDDLLDIEGDHRILGKQTGSDCKNQKATYPGTVGIERARAEAAQLIDEALALFTDYDDNPLKYLARYIGQRER
ncbi:MAG: farnesyl diphosphate synthase [candidate division Zixibacteria bacterium]|nr:farnesyl diphosphate synthase [candidate division Zixibacteria bacterium]